jgi:hypothetical protein
MSLNTVTLTWNLADLTLAAQSVKVTVAPTHTVKAPPDSLIVAQKPRSVTSTGAGSMPDIVACDNAGLTPASWGYRITAALTAEPHTILVDITTPLNFSDGATQDLSGL